MPDSNSTDQECVIKFIRQHDYRFVRELGSGACGKTVLLYDDIIDEEFVCKKYSPIIESLREKLFKNFVLEIKLLHNLQHINVVRVFNYYLYPDHFTGYILMEYVDGVDIEEYISKYPEKTNELFLQAIRGFNYLESKEILHRDIRPMNLLVTKAGTLKIIDLGFGKQVIATKDFDKSINLNWWCEPPEDFKEDRYDYSTEVYFVGRLFEKLIRENDIEHFHYPQLLHHMCEINPSERIQRFSLIAQTIKSDQFSEIAFDEKELDAYRDFSRELCRHVARIERGTKYNNDIMRIDRELSDAYRGFMLEEYVPSALIISQIFINGAFRYRISGFPVRVVRKFMTLLKSCSNERKKIILANLHTKLDAVDRYEESHISDDEVPF